MNMVVTEAMAILISVTAVLIFAEILPQAICTGPNQMAIAYTLAPVIRGLMAVEIFIAYPIAFGLDKLLGEKKKNRYTNEDLKALLELHTRSVVHEIVEHNMQEANGLSEGQNKLIAGAIDMKNYVIRDAMREYSDVEIIDYNQLLTQEFLKGLAVKGYSRYPVYKSYKENVIGILLVKKLLVLDRFDMTLAKLNVPLRMPLVAHPEGTLADLLMEFQKGKSHMALVTTQVDALKKRIRLQSSASEYSAQLVEQEAIPILGIVTIEDIVEKIIGLQILDEDDYDRKYLAYLVPKGHRREFERHKSKHLEKQAISELKKQESQSYLYKDVIARRGGEMYSLRMSVDWIWWKEGIRG